MIGELIMAIQLDTSKFADVLDGELQYRYAEAQWLAKTGLGGCPYSSIGYEKRT